MLVLVFTEQSQQIPTKQNLQEHEVDRLIVKLDVKQGQLKQRLKQVD